MRGTTRSGKYHPGSCTVQVSTCTCESFCSCLVTSPQIRQCGVSVKKRKLDEEESKMLKADLIVKRIDDELKAKKSKFIEFCIEKNNLDEQIAAEEDLLKAHNEEMVEQKNRNQEELDLLVHRKKQAEEDYKQRGKQVKNIKSKIAALQAELNNVDDTRLELVHEQDLCEAWIREVDSERIKLEQSIEKQQYEYEEKVAKKYVEIENLKIRLSEVLNGIENLPSDAPYKGLREFIEKEIATKEKELECPICMVVAASPILTCSEQHLICSLCRTKTEQCPVCSRSYHGKHKRHRYAEQALEEVTRLRRELEGLMARTAEEDEDNPSSSPCTLSSTASPPTSPPPLLMTNHHTMLMQQKTFIPNRSLLSKLQEIGVPLERALTALFHTGNKSVGLAINWLLEDRDSDTAADENIEGIREACDGHQERNVMITRGMMEEEEEDSDMEENLELVLVLLVNKSLNLSAGKMSMAGARAAARLTMQVEEVIGMDTVVMWDQCGRSTEVRGVEDTKEMETIFHQVKMYHEQSGFMGLPLLADFDQQWTVEGEEKKVLAVFGEMEEVHDILGHLPAVR